LIQVNDKLLIASNFKVIYMATTIIDPGDFSDYSSRHVTIEFTGGCHRELMRKAKYTKTISYSCLSQTIQSINRLGGTITRVTLSPSHTQVSKAESISSSPQSQEHNISEDTYQVTKPTQTQQVQQAMPAATPAGNAVATSVEYTFTDEW
jgi:CpcD/allophycocyanin linker domain